MAGIHITDIESAINYWRAREPSPDGISLPAPTTSGAATELATIVTRMSSQYGKGKGTLNGQPIRSSGECELKFAMGMASLPVATDPENPAVKRFLKALTKLQTVQRSGSAALNLAYVASGRIDCFWSSSLHPWDVAAGALLVAETGGTITKLDGSTFDVFVPDLLSASTALLGQKLVTALG